MNVSKIKDSIK